MEQAIDTVEFTDDADEQALIHDIVMRFMAPQFLGIDKDWPSNAGLHYEMNLSACHASGCPLDFERMLAASDDTLAHDMCGIDTNICKDTGTLKNHFLPKCAKKG